MNTLNNFKTEKQTKLSVELTLVTPELAKNYLKFNPKNRKISEKNLFFLTNEMRDNRFLENGESIIFDKNGNLKDGQHRLSAIIKSGKSYFIPIVRGVEPNAMSTYDTGKNRNATDVLQMNGFKYAGEISGLIFGINRYVKNNSKATYNRSGNKSLGSKSGLTNQQVLEFCQDNYDWLFDIVSVTKSIYDKSKPKVLSCNNLSLMAFILGGETPPYSVFEFLKYLSGLSKIEGTSTSYLFTKLYNAKINKEPLNFYWILGMTIKAYNYFIDGNPSVNFFKFSVEQELPKVNSND